MKLPSFITLLLAAALACVASSSVAADDAPAYPGQPNINGALKHLSAAKEKAPTDAAGAIAELAEASDFLSHAIHNKGTYGHPGGLLHSGLHAAGSIPAILIWAPQNWLVVVLVTGFSFLGYAANRIFGERHGTIATALIGGAYSSTAVTQSLAQRLGSERRAGAENAGIALASAVMYLRVLVLIGVLSTRVLLPFAVILAPALVVAWVAGLWLYRTAPTCDAPAPPGNPIAILPAMGFVAFVAFAAVVAKWASGRFGEQGIAALLLIVGSTDVDTAIITLGNLPANAISPLLAAMAIAGTIIANMAVKIGITLAYARGRGLPAVIAMAASVAVLAISIALAWTRL